MLKSRSAECLTSPQKSRGRPKLVSDDVQRAAIVAQAYELFREEGYARSTTDEVAARCKISKRTLYRLFPSKTALFGAMMDAHRQSMLDLPGEYDHLSLTDALEHIFKVDIDEKADHERMAFLRLVILEAVQFPELDAIAIEHGRDMALALLAEWLEHQRARGRVDIGNATNTAKMLMDMIFGALISKRDGELDWPGDVDRKEYVRTCIKIFVNGIGTSQK